MYRLALSTAAVYLHHLAKTQVNSNEVLLADGSIRESPDRFLASVAKQPKARWKRRWATWSMITRTYSSLELVCG